MQTVYFVNMKNRRAAHRFESVCIKTLLYHSRTICTNNFWNHNKEYLRKISIHLVYTIFCFSCWYPEQTHAHAHSHLYSQRVVFNQNLSTNCYSHFYKYLLWTNFIYNYLNFGANHIKFVFITFSLSVFGVHCDLGWAEWIHKLRVNTHKSTKYTRVKWCGLCNVAERMPDNTPFILSSMIVRVFSFHSLFQR